MQPSEQYGRLTLLVRCGPPNRRQWQCRRTCARLVTVQEANIRSGKTRSCGCLRQEWLATHREAAKKWTTPEYRAWVHLRRHSRLCPQWHGSFGAFLDDVGRRPSPEHVLVRTKCGRMAGPGTVAWMPRQDTGRMVSERPIRIGRESHTVREWARLRGISHATIYNRLKAGWTVREAIFTPAQPGGRPRSPSSSAARAVTHGSLKLGTTSKDY
jgi:hypothetical protein